MRLVVAVPALMARQALGEGKNRELYQRILAARTGRPVGDIQLRLVAAGLSAALSEVARYWAEQHGTPPLTAVMDQAVTTFEPLLEGLG